MKRSKIYTYILMVFAGACLLSGCSKEAKESRANYRQAGITCMEQGDYAGAIEAFDAALSQKIGSVDADDIDISYYKAAAQYAGGDVEGAVATYNAIIAYLPKEVPAYYQLGCIYLKTMGLEQAQVHFSNAIKYQSDNYELYINIHDNLLAAGYGEEALAYLDKAFLIKGSDVTDNEYRGKMYQMLGEYDNAITELTAAKEKGSVVADLYLGQVYASMGETTQAENAYQAYLAVNAKDSVGLNAIGRLMMGAGRYEEAIAYLKQGLEAESVINKQELMRNLVEAYEYNGDFDKAWEVIQEYVALYPEDAAAQTEYIFLKNRQVKEPEAAE